MIIYFMLKGSNKSLYLLLCNPLDRIEQQKYTILKTNYEYFRTTLEHAVNLG